MQFLKSIGLTASIAATAALLCIPGCGEKSNIPVEKRLFGDMPKGDRDQIAEAIAKAGYPGQVVGIEAKADHWLVEYEIVKVGKDGKKKRASPKLPDQFKVTKAGKVTKL